MSIPVVGSVLLATLLFGDFGASRKQFRQALVPTPSSQATTLILGGGADSENEEEEDEDEDVPIRDDDMMMGSGGENEAASLCKQQ